MYVHMEKWIDSGFIVIVGKVWESLAGHCNKTHQMRKLGSC